MSQTLRDTSAYTRSEPIKRPLQEGCEWNPTEKRAVYDNEPHWLNTHASVIVGHNGKWRLCADCAALPDFKRYRSRREINDRPRKNQQMKFTKDNIVALIKKVIPCVVEVVQTGDTVRDEGATIFIARTSSNEMDPGFLTRLEQRIGLESAGFSVAANNDKLEVHVRFYGRIEDPQ